MTTTDELFDRVCALRARDLVDTDRALSALDALAAPDRARDLAARFWIPLRGRVLARMDQSDVKLGAWMPDDVRAAARDEMGKPLPLPRRAVEDAVGSEKVRDAVRTMLQESLTNFVQKAGSALNDRADKSSGGGALRGVLGFGAKAAGKMLGGIGEEIQHQLQDRVRDFVDGAVASVQSRIVERLTSDDTAKTLGKRRQKLYDAVVDAPEREAARRVRKADWARIDADSPKVLAHNLARPEVRDFVRAELAQLTTDLGDQTVGDVLDALGLRDHARAVFAQVGALLDATPEAPEASQPST